MATTSLIQKNSFLSDTKILLVDPDSTTRSLLSGVIESLKPARFMITKSIPEALQAMKDGVDVFDCVIAAIKNPPATGFHLLREIRSGNVPRVPHDTRFILVSPPPNKTMISLAGSLDADGLLVVPLSAATVQNTISAALKRERELKPIEVYGGVNLPRPVKKKKPEDAEKARPNAGVVLSPVDKERAALLRSLEEIKAQSEQAAIEAARIENIRTFWLKDLLPNMVLAEDVTGDDDEMILSSGTLLNEALIEKMKKLSEVGLCRSFLKAGSGFKEN